MLLLDLLFELFGGLLWIIVPVGIILYFDSKRSSNKNTPNALPPQVKSNQNWVKYLTSLRSRVKTQAEKNLIDAILQGKNADELYDNEQSTQPSPAAAAVAAKPTPTESKAAVADEPVEPGPELKQTPIAVRPPEHRNNTLLLLYFGAFLFVASAGLFVAIGSFSGGTRTVVLFITTLLLYLSGLWIYKNKPKLRQAGISFMGVAMVIAPLVGTAWYVLIAGREFGPQIWFATSIVCVGLYLHAYKTASNSFTAYLFIGGLVSSVMSGVFTAGLPDYVMIWALIALSLGIQFARGKTEQAKPLDDAGDASAQLLVPLSMFSSLVMTEQYGSFQLGGTLILSGAYYALLASNTPKQFTSYITASQASVIFGSASLAYAQSESITVTALVLSILGAGYTFAVASLSRELSQRFNVITVGALPIIGSIFLSYSEPWLFVACVGLFTFFTGAIWLKTLDNSALALCGASLIALALLVGQHAFEPRADPTQQTALFAAPLLLLFGIVLSTRKISWLAMFYHTASNLYMGCAAILLASAWVSGFELLAVSTGAILASFIVLFYITKDSDWWIMSSVTVLLPVLYGFMIDGYSSSAFSWSVLSALAVNIAIALVSRRQQIRWILVGVILISPIALGAGGLGINWQEAGFSYAYLLAMGGCILARAIARGKLFVSFNAPLESYEYDASQSYIAGYVISSMIALFVSLQDENTQLVTSVVIGLVILAAFYVSRKVEENEYLLSIQPVLLQALLFSIIRPDISDGTFLSTIAISSSVLSAAIYLIAEKFNFHDPGAKHNFLMTATIAAYIGPGLVFIAPITPIGLPIALFAAGLLTLYHSRQDSIDDIEFSSAVNLAALHWLLYLADIRNVHVHTHVLAAFLAVFAYIRYKKADTDGYNQHVIALYLVTTVPLIWQALGSGSGEYYGLVLIVQQTVYMVIGILFNERFLLKAGLYTALGSVLYQLRGLGWAFLAIIAVTLITIAIYRLQSEKDNPKDKDQPQ